MPEAEDNGGLVFGKRGRATTVGFAVGLAVAVHGGSSIGLVHNDQMEQLINCGFLSGIREIKGATVAVAPGDPVTAFTLAQHNGVKEIAGTLNTHHTTATLVDIGQLTPNLDGLGFEINRQVGALQE